MERLDCEIGEIETWIVDSAATRHMTPNPVSMTNYRECDGVVHVANGVAPPIEGVGDIPISFNLTLERPIYSFLMSLLFLF